MLFLPHLELRQSQLCNTLYQVLFLRQHTAESALVVRRVQTSSAEFQELNLGS